MPGAQPPALVPPPAAVAAPAPRGSAKDLYELMAVLIGICESLADSLDGDRHGELARVGLLAASRAAGLVADLRLDDTGVDAGRNLREQRAAPRVLIVEDDADLLNLLVAAFARAGFTAYAARHGRAAVQLLDEIQPALMVTDIVMPELEGIGVIMEAKKRVPGLRVIAISGGGQYGRSHNFLEWARELGADEVLAKPFRMSSLVTAARLVLEPSTDRAALAN